MISPELHETLKSVDEELKKTTEAFDRLSAVLERIATLMYVEDYDEH